MSYMSKYITAYNGEKILVDDEDFARLSSHKYHIGAGYAVRSVVVGGIKRKRGIAYDVLQIEPKEGMCIDHINHDKLDNRRENLRIVTLQHNSQNKSSHKKASSKYLGVYKNSNAREESRIWKMTITQSFYTEEEAARCYDLVASFLFGENANLNFPS